MRQATSPRPVQPSSRRRTALRCAAALLPLLVSVLCVSPARAEEGRVNVHAGVGAGLLVTDVAAPGVSSTGLDFTLKVDLPVHRFIAPQIGYGLIYLPGDGGSEVGVNLVMFGARVRLLNDERGYLANLWPKGPKGNAWGNLWLDFNLGYAHAPTTAGPSDWFALEVGLGYEFSLASPLQMGPYLAYRHVFKNGTDASFIAVGVSISFGYPKQIPKAAPQPRARRRPAPRPNIQGRPGDRDGDAVADAADQCPSTPPGAKVDAKGCEYIRGRMVFPRIRFQGQTATLVPGARFEIRRLGEMIRAHPEVTVEIGGHTDSPGGPEENLKLSLQRAQVVRDVLIGQGVPATQLTVRGFGATAPVAPPGSPEAQRQGNVRIEFRFSVNQPRPEP